MGREPEESTMIRRLLPFKMALAALIFAACVTVNVYFPAAATERAADQLINDITGQPGKGAATDPKQPEAGDAITSHDAREPDVSMWALTIGRTLEMLVPPAHAQASADIDISTPEIRAIRDSMKQRFAQLEPFFASGAIGLTSNGDVAVRDQASVPLADRATVKRLVAEDNADRAALYAEIAKANGHPDGAPEIRSAFARRWIETGAKPGWYYQDSGGNWTQK
jgi:uncharacterized protein